MKETWPKETWRSNDIGTCTAHGGYNGLTTYQNSLGQSMLETLIHEIVK